MKAVVTGASRGIGLELVRQLVARGDVVDAGARDPDRAVELRALTPRVHRLDVSDGASVAAFASAVGEAPIDLVINNAGIDGGPAPGLRQLAANLAFDDVLRTYDVNAAGALRVTVALLPRLHRGSKLVHVTSGMGSIGDNTSGGAYAYRMSKAALNMMSKSLAVDLRGEGIISFVINPGWVQTDLGGARAPLPVAESVKNLLARIDEATLDHSGEFLNWKGGRYPW